MSNSTKPRIVRSHFPKRELTIWTYRENAWDCLALDFSERCAYSMQHRSRAGGRTGLEIDHFNPKKKRDHIQEYTNLFLATGHCNRMKGDRWPNKRDFQNRLRFLNCCKETDYGVHIFEDPDTHEVVGVTPEGTYHVRHCDLNARHFVEERKRRSELWRVLNAQAVKLKLGWSLPEEFKLLKAVAEEMIPEFPFLSGDALEKRRALKKELAALV